MVLAFSRALTPLKERAFWPAVWHGIWVTTAAFIDLSINVWMEAYPLHSPPMAQVRFRLLSTVHASQSPLSALGVTPEMANRKPTAPRRALPKSVHSIRDASPVAVQMAAVATGARDLATIVGMVRAPLMAP